MPDIDWNALEIERDSYLRKHKRFMAGMNAALHDIRRREVERLTIQRIEAFLATKPPAYRFRLADYVADKQRSFR